MGVPFVCVQPITTATPSLARAHDYLLGGTNHFVADRALAKSLLATYPLAAELVRENRLFAARAVALVAGRGVRQFADIGAGLPTPPSAHQVAGQVAGDVRVAYVDNDPAVLAHSAALLTAATGVRAVPGDLREPEAILASSEFGNVIDLARPVCLILTLMLDCLDAGTARAVVGVLTRRIVPGSYLVISVAVNREKGPLLPPVADDAVSVQHAPQDVESFFGGAELEPPGLADARAWIDAAWTDANRDDSRPGYVLCGIGRKAG